VVLGDAQKRYDIVAGGEEARKKKLMEQFPNEEKAINKYFKLVKKSRKAFDRAMIMKSLPLPFARFLVRSRLHRLLDGGFHKWASITVEEGLERLTSNKELKAVLAYNWGDYGVEPSRAPFIMQLLCSSTFLDGAYYPHGGPSMMYVSRENVHCCVATP
jgi:all-trans-retinol 13,14-reductase